MSTSAPDNVSLLTFPVEFPIKVMGRTQPDFAQTMLQIVQSGAPDFDPGSIEMRSSREGRYLSLTFTIRARSREQLDALYHALSEHPMVSMVL